MLTNLIHLKRQLNRMKLRHDLWKKKYPDSLEKHGIPWMGIANASAEIKALAQPEKVLSTLPFDRLEYIEHLDHVPFDLSIGPDISR